MCQQIRDQGIDVNSMVFDNEEKAIEFLHGQYHLAKAQCDNVQQ